MSRLNMGKKLISDTPRVSEELLSYRVEKELEPSPALYKFVTMKRAGAIPRTFITACTKLSCLFSYLLGVRCGTGSSEDGREREKCCHPATAYSGHSNYKYCTRAPCRVDFHRS